MYSGITSGAGSLGQINTFQQGSSPTPIAPIQEAMQRQETAVVHLHERIAALENRLACICAPSPAAGQTSAPQPPTPSSHHQRLMTLAAAIENADCRLGALLDQLQL